jgi:integrase/recombinase XerD
MSTLRESAEQYLRLRRDLGCQLREAGRLLHDFLAFAEREGASHITTDLAVRWAKQPAGAQPVTWALRLRVVRRFALWLSATDRRTEVPPAGLLPGRYVRRRPYIYSDAEIADLVRAAGRLASAAGLKGRTYATIFGLLAVTGMRVSEVLALDREDVDLGEGVLRIRRTKFGKSRLVAVHDSTREALSDYARERDRVVHRPATAAFFLSEGGDRVTGGAARYNFAKVSREIGLRAPARGRRHGRGPRLHDMRHRFAVCTLLRWYRSGIDVEREIPKLATYLGHVHVNETYWYLEAVPELLGLAARRLESPGEVEP